MLTRRRTIAGIFTLLMIGFALRLRDARKDFLCELMLTTAAYWRDRGET
jgi:hypothetical protein